MNTNFHVQNDVTMQQLQKLKGMAVSVPEHTLNGTDSRCKGLLHGTISSIIEQPPKDKKARFIIRLELENQEGELDELYVHPWQLFHDGMRGSLYCRAQLSSKSVVYDFGAERNAVFAAAMRSLGLNTAIVLDGPTANTSKAIRSAVGQSRAKLYSVNNNQWDLLQISASTRDVPIFTSTATTRRHAGSFMDLLHLHSESPQSLSKVAQTAFEEAPAIFADQYGVWRGDQDDAALQNWAANNESTLFGITYCVRNSIYAPSAPDGFVEFYRRSQGTMHTAFYVRAMHLALAQKTAENVIRQRTSKKKNTATRNLKKTSPRNLRKKTTVAKRKRRASKESPNAALIGKQLSVPYYWWNGCPKDERHRVEKGVVVRYMPKLVRFMVKFESIQRAHMTKEAVHAYMN